MIDLAAHAELSAEIERVLRLMAENLAAMRALRLYLRSELNSAVGSPIRAMLPK
jgi:hypothetical protein